MIKHIICDMQALDAMKVAIKSSPDMGGNIVLLKDNLAMGPLKEEGQPFSKLRQAFHRQLGSDLVVDDRERILEMRGQMHRQNSVYIWFWMAPSVQDLCGYYSVLPFFSRYSGQFYLLNLDGLPFIDGEDRLFFAKRLGEIPSKELIKASKLRRPISSLEVEIGLDEWQKLSEENAPLRLRDGGQKIVSCEENLYDELLLQFLLQFCPKYGQKISTVIRRMYLGQSICASKRWLLHRILILSYQNRLRLQEVPGKSPMEWEVKKIECLSA